MQLININSIAFYFPYHEISGVPVLFSNLANFISNNFQLEVSIVDFADGYMTKALKNNKKIKKIIFETGRNVYINTDVLIMQSILPFGMRPELNISLATKILFWNLHPQNLIPNIYPWIIFNKSYPKFYKFLASTLWKKNYCLIKDFVIKSSNQGGLVFMDSANLINTENFYSIDLGSISYLPIACSDGRLRDINHKKDINKIHLSWIGRLCGFKIHILNYLISRLSLVAKDINHKISLHIIGDGPEEKKLNYKKHLNSYFDIVKHGSLNKLEADELLFSTIDLNASMGTSVLESSKFGIPSIVLDISLKPIIQNYKFRWLHETIDYDVGHFISESDISNGNQSLKLMIEEFITNQEFLAQKSYDYYLTNHSLKEISNKLLVQGQKSELTISKIHPNLIQKGLLRRFYERKKYGRIN